MLDVAVRPAQKQAFSAWLGRLASRAGKIGYGGSAFLDKVFGKPVFSLKAVPRYALISLCSIALSYAFAVLSSPPHVQPFITIFPEGMTALSATILTSASRLVTNVRCWRVADISADRRGHLAISRRKPLR